MHLADKVAIVTGSGGLGSGRAAALRLAAGGCHVVVSDVDASGARETVERIRGAGGSAEFCLCDVGSETAVAALVEYAETRFGGLDILVNNAAAAYRPGAPIESWYHTLQVDLLGTIHALRFAIPALRRRGGGAIVNVSSTSALGHGDGHSKAPAYDIGKIGVLRLTTTLRGLAEEAQIRVNCLVPDWLATPEVKAYWDGLDVEERRRRNIPPVLTSLEEVAESVVDLICDPTLAGRVMVCWSGQPRGLIGLADAGYGDLEPYSRCDRA